MPRYIDADKMAADESEAYMRAQASGQVDIATSMVNHVVHKKIQMLIAQTPTVDAAPVVHGRWIPRNKGQNNWCECSECNTVGSPFWKRCPVCEAKMDGGKDNGS